MADLLRKEYEEILVHTGQHCDLNLSDIFFKGLQIPQSNYHLEVGSESLGKQTSVILEKVENVLMKEMPDLVLVYEDPNSSLTGDFPISGVGTMRLFLDMQTYKRLT